MKVTASKSVSFPSLGWGIEAGEVKELPSDKEAQEEILKCYVISKADSGEKPASAKGEKLNG